jgi:hypothetical protein
MKEKLSLGLVAIVCVALLASGAMGGQVFFSTATDVGQGAAPLSEQSVDGDLTLGIWATSDQDYDTSIGMNVLSDAPANVALTAGEVKNPDIISELAGTAVDVRWQDVAVGEVTAAQITKMNAARVTVGTGILLTNNGTVPPFLNVDPLFDQDAGAFLLGTVTVSGVGPDGSSSVLSINEEGTATFVNAGQAVTPDFMPVTLSVGVANIPEPSTLVLVAFGLVAMLGYGLKR